MRQARRGILLGLGFTLEALRAAGLDAAELDAPQQATLSAVGHGTDIIAVRFDTSQRMIETGDGTGAYVPGLRRASVTFTVSQRAVHTWIEAVMAGEPVDFSEEVQGHRLTCRLYVTDVRTDCPVDGLMTATVTAQVIGAPTITALPQVAPSPAAQVPQGRRGMKLNGALID